MPAQNTEKGKEQKGDVQKAVDKPSQTEKDGPSPSSSAVPHYFCGSCGVSWASSSLVPHGGFCCGKAVSEGHIEKADAKKLEQPTIRVARSKRGQEQDIGKYSKSARTGQQQDGRTGQQQE